VRRLVNDSRRTLRGPGGRISPSLRMLRRAREQHPMLPVLTRSIWINRPEHGQLRLVPAASMALEAGRELGDLGVAVHARDIDPVHRPRRAALGALSYGHLRFRPSGSSRSGPSSAPLCSQHSWALQRRPWRHACRTSTSGSAGRTETERADVASQIVQTRSVRVVGHGL